MLKFYFILFFITFICISYGKNIIFLLSFINLIYLFLVLKQIAIQSIIRHLFILFVFIFNKSFLKMNLPHFLGIRKRLKLD